MATKLADLKKEDISNIVASMQRCIGFIDYIDALLKLSLSKTSFEERGKLNFTFPVTSIENEPGYLIFLEMIGAEFDPPEDLIETMKSKPKGFAPFAYLLPAITKETIPAYPWNSINETRVIYKEEIEDSYRKLDQNAMVQKTKTEDQLGRVNFPAEFEAYMAKLSEFPRSREIITIYSNYLLAKELGYEINLIEPFTSKELPVINSVESNFNDTGKILKELFHSHYKKIKNEQKITLPKYTDASDPYWGHLLNAAKSLTIKLLILESENQTALKIIREDASKLNERSNTKISIPKNKLDLLYSELIEFFEKNKINYRDKDKIRFPLVKEIKKLEGGPKIIKKITDGDGDQIKGFSKIGEGFKEYLLNEKYDPLKLMPLLKLLEDQSTSLDRKIESMDKEIKSLEDKNASLHREIEALDKEINN